MLERSHLLVVREIARAGSMTAAADALHVSQSALSHTVRKLETFLGTPLWHREGRSLRLTQAGEYLLAVAERLLPQLDHVEARIRQLARGERGTLRIGMECHPCYQWLLKIAASYLEAWPGVDVDVVQKFQFGGIGALFGHEIDVLVTPDPLRRPGLSFEPVFDYEQVLVVAPGHPLAGAAYVTPAQLSDEVLITYPVTTDRLDVFSMFLTPAGIMPRRHKTIETTDIMLQMVASGRGVAALPRWLVAEYADKVDVAAVRLGRRGIAKQIHLGLRADETRADYLNAFLDMARRTGNPMSGCGGAPRRRRGSTGLSGSVMPRPAR